MTAANDDEPFPEGVQHPPAARSQATKSLCETLHAQGYTPTLSSRSLDMLDHSLAGNTKASAELIAELTADASTPYGTLTQSLGMANAALNALAHEFNVTQKPNADRIKTLLSQAPQIAPREMAERIGNMRAAVASFDRYHTAFDALSTQATELASLWTRHHNCLNFIESHTDRNAPDYRRDLRQYLEKQGFNGAAAMRIANTASVGAQQLYIQQAVSEDLQALRQSIQVTSGDVNDPTSGLAQLVNLATMQLARADAAMQQMYEAAKARHEAPKSRD